jgi:hypothetical protein
MAIATFNAKEEGNYMAISGNGNDKEGIKPTESYAVIVEKKKEEFIIKNIMDLMTDNELSLEECLLIIELSLKLEKIEGKLVSEEQIKQILDEVLRGIKFEVISPANYIVARDYFKKMMEEKKIKIPYDEELKEELLTLTPNTIWEDYNPKVRHLIGLCWAASKNAFAISIDSSAIPKTKMVQIFKIFFTGDIKEAILKQLKEQTKHDAQA